jgi:hypothetical protein
MLSEESAHLFPFFRLSIGLKMRISSLSYLILPYLQFLATFIVYRHEINRVHPVFFQYVSKHEVQPL